MSKSVFASLTAGWKAVFQGAGFIAPPNPGNMANAPANPSVQTGNYQFIIKQMFDGIGSMITDIPVIPPAFRDWGQYGVNVMGISGDTGGGATGDVPQISNGATFYYDDDSGQYVDLNLLNQVTGVATGG